MAVVGGRRQRAPQEHRPRRLAARRPTGELDVSLPYPRAPRGRNDGALRCRALRSVDATMRSPCREDVVQDALDDQEGKPEMPPRHELARALVENRRAFLSFLESRVGRHEVAEDVLQEAFARSLDKLPLENDESAVAWFYRVLRNAVVDHMRRRGSAQRALESFAAEVEGHAEPEQEMRGA